jgi:hypothetical protein
MARLSPLSGYSQMLGESTRRYSGTALEAPHFCLPVPVQGSFFNTSFSSNSRSGILVVGRENLLKITCKHFDANRITTHKRGYGME